MTTPDPAAHPQDASTQPLPPVPAPPQPVAPHQDAQPVVAAPSQPAPSQPVAPQPVATQPIAPQPVATQPIAPQPQAAHPQQAVTQPVAPQPVAPQQHPAQAFAHAPYAAPQPAAPSNDPWSVMPAPAATTNAPRKKRIWIPITAAAAGAALLAAAATLGVTGALGDNDGPSTAGTSSASIATLGQDTNDAVPVSGSTDDDPDWQAVAKAVQPSVVAIAVTTDQGGAQGSGVIVDSAGHIVTNNHVVSGSTSVSVTLTDGRIFDATVVGTDPTTDLAVVKLVDPPSDLTPAALGDSSDVQVGQAVMAVGNPLGLANTVTTGIVSAVDRPVSTQGEDSSETTVTNAIQIDAAVNPGNSGGPLFDAQGRVIGINSSIATLSSESGSIGLGFAIPVNLVKNVAQQLVDDGTVKHAFLGVGLDDGTATADGVTRAGAVVKQVNDGSPAAAAGLQLDDVVVAIDGSPVGGAESLTAYVRSYTSGDQVTLTLVRDGKALDVDVTLATREDTSTQSQQGQGQQGQQGDGQQGDGQQGVPGGPNQGQGDGSLGGLSPEELWQWYQQQQEQQNGQG
ncbi:S1C family serine protease [Cellulomonas composti]|uniref:PDZ domain-containing protein n=1 Tax=Cellulomonas composti TaxID=266130 RepID=A0A511JEI7_9CELL|nr:trypsin-like peptidase domain-containing protein [Cellulomonas composti]GEL96385.1 hypothetical protein CCO02nite_30430 [Cellulomonas composti]